MVWSTGLMAVLLAALLQGGCVYSYYSVESREFKPDLTQSYVDNGATPLDTLWVSSQRCIFYSRDFSYCRRHGDGDVFYFVKEAICRLPTVLIEVPFWLLNRDLAVTRDA